MALVAFPMLIGLAVVARPLVESVLPRWEPAVVLVLLLTPVGMVRSVSSTTASIYVSTGRTDTMFRWSIVFGVATVLGFLCGVPWGVSGVAAALQW